MLRGGSVVDWTRLNYTAREQIDAFLRVHQFDPATAVDRARLRGLVQRAAAYLEETLHDRLPSTVKEAEAADVFLYACRQAGSLPEQQAACRVLKVAHIIHHIEARELRYRLPMSQSDIAGLISARVLEFVEGLQREDFPLVSATGGEKGMASLITKLLVKKETHAAAIRDRIRFRFVVEEKGDLIPLLHEIAQHLVPFNYVVPGSTVNHLINFTALVESHQAYRNVADSFQVKLGVEDNERRPFNEFSGPGFEVINFVAEVPVRVPEDILAGEWLKDLGPVVLGLAEFQVVDQHTDAGNQDGENSHDEYKARKQASVRRRLYGGGVRAASPDDAD